MCGIVGAWCLRVDQEQRSSALNAIGHRGPDASQWLELNASRGPVNLGHRRLSIIDLSTAANQPFRKDGIAIIYNGEIYNFRELRAELESFGVSFRTNSDTEVIVEAFRKWGEDCFRRFRGMFALAIYDEAKEALILARDHFGIKPLYVYRGPNGSLAFASELRALFAMGLPRNVNSDAIWASMLLMFVPESICAFKGYEKLPAGSFLKVDAEGIEICRFWNHEALIQHDGGRDSCSIKRLRSVIENSVAAHMTADVPVSTFLSGGLDSSILTVLAKRHNPQLEAYTIRVAEADLALEGMPQDIHYARKLAKEHGIRLHEIEASPDIAEWLPRMMNTLEEPISDPATVNVMMICEAARQAGAKVLLSGMGADEIFGGYRRHQAMMLAQNYRRLPQFLKSGVGAVTDALPVAAFGRALTPVRWAKRFLSFAGSGSEADAYLRSYSYYDTETLSALTNEQADNVLDLLVRQHRAHFEFAAAQDLPTKMNFTDLHYFLPGLNLAYSDRASMYASTEVRTPFVDIEVAKAAFQIGGDRKTDMRKTKIALKQAAEAWLPSEIVYRPKASFGVPLRSWMRGPLAERVKAMSSGGKLVELGYIDRERTQTMLTEFLENKFDWSYQLWHLLALETWVDQAQ